MDPKDVPGWLDILTALWIIVAAAAFLVKVLIDTGLITADYGIVVVTGRYAYMIMVTGCIIGVSLSLVRALVRGH